MEPNTQQQATQQPPQSNDEKIGDFARGFLSEIEEHQDPDQMGLDEEQPQEQQPEAEQQPEEQPQEESEQETPQEPEIPMVELELEDGEKVLVPEKAKAGYMRDKDYRQKTMALAETRKSLEQLTAQAQQIATQAQQMAPYYAQLHSMDSRAAQLEKSLQSPELINDPIEYNRTQGELAILLRNRDQLASGLHYAQSQFYEQQAQIRAQRLAVEAPKLFEEIPDLAKNEVRESLGKYVRDQGVSDEEYAHMNYSPAATKLAWKAQQYDRLIKEQAAAKKNVAQKLTKPSASAPSSSRAGQSGPNVKDLRAAWKKDGNSIQSEAFSAILRQRIRGK